MKFSKSRPVKIVMLGGGGTGGHIAPHLYRLLYALDRPVRFIIADADVVETKNLVRQNFIHADLGENKAKTLAERYSSAFGLETEYVPAYIENEDQLRELVKPACWKSNYRAVSSQDFVNGTWMTKPPDVIAELVILIGAVDNNRSRRLCQNVFGQARDLVYIDSGNGEHTGQVVCGVRSGGRTLYKPLRMNQALYEAQERQFKDKIAQLQSYYDEKVRLLYLIAERHGIVPAVMEDPGIIKHLLSPIDAVGIIKVLNAEIVK